MTDARWRVVTDTQITDLTATGTFVTSREITFELLDFEASGTIKVPMRNYTKEEVASRIQKYANDIADVRRLSAE